MPNNQKHIIVGAIVAGIIYLLLKQTQWVSVELEPWGWIVVVLIVYIFSQLADIDSDISIINKIWNTAAGLVGIYALYTGTYKVFGMLAIGSIVFLEYAKHRGVCHEEWFLIALAAPLWFVNPLFFFIAAGVAVSHTIIDGDFTK